jgi:predicted Zn-dependent protease
MMKIRLPKILHTTLLLILAFLFLHGCARHRPPRHPPREPVQSEQEQILRPEPEQRQETIQEEDIEPSQQESIRQEHKERLDPELKAQKGPAQTLFRDAEQALQEGQYKRAEMLLERALRIEPKNGWYWHAMGQVQYNQGSFDQAMQFCRKSNSLSGKDTDLKRKNQVLLEKIQRKTGDRK